MNKKVIQNALIALTLLGLSVGLFSAFLGRKSSQTTQPNQSEKINLALRRTAHLLLKQAGDSTSTIAPVNKTDENSYLVKLEHHFNYDSLPLFLENSFSLQGVIRPYNVSVWDSKNEALILGYNSADILKGESIPCTGRNPSLDYINFKVTFTDLPAEKTQFNLLWLAPVIIILLGGLYFFYSRKKEVFTAPNEPQIADEDQLIRIGKSIFDTHNQIIFIENTTQKLTFREAKLLNLFCEHKNELLDRDFILKSVWEDEGVLVGRSVDVFVSRLRKILKEDDTLKITNVHGRGYRFETEV